MTHAPANTLSYFGEQLKKALLNPIQAFRWQYLPLLMVYFAYGALGLVAVAETFWIKNNLKLTPAELASLTVWLTLPWTIKMVFGELVDAVPILGSQRRVYVLTGGVLIAAGLLMLAGAAGGWLTFTSPENIYRIGSFLNIVGVVLQDVTADAMSTEVVARTNPDGTPRPKEDVNRDLGMVQVLGRLALSFGMFSVAGISGWLASIYSYETVFLMGLIIPVISVTGAMLVKLDKVESRPVDWRILGGGLFFGMVVALLGWFEVPYNQEIVFAVSMAVVIAMLTRVVGDLDIETKRKIFYAAVIIFVFRAAPSVGSGYTWFTMDVLGFDEAFLGTLSQIGTALALAGTWLFSDAITRQAGGKGPVVAYDRQHGAVAAELGLDAGAARVDRAHVRVRCANHRHHRYGGFFAVRAALHDPAADAVRHLCAGGPSRELVCAHGVVDESRSRRGRAADEVSQHGAGGGSRKLRQPAGTPDDRHGDWVYCAVGRDIAVRQPHRRACGTRPDSSAGGIDKTPSFAAPEI